MMGSFLLIGMAIVIFILFIVAVISVLISHDKKIKELQQKLYDKNFQ
jgi:predicted Holliday junction resolvase-like endonuclease